MRFEKEETVCSWNAITPFSLFSANTPVDIRQSLFGRPNEEHRKGVSGKREKHPTKRAQQYLSSFETYSAFSRIIFCQKTFVLRSLSPLSSPSSIFLIFSWWPIRFFPILLSPHFPISYQSQFSSP